MSLETLKPKVAELIKIALNEEGGGEKTVIEYPKFNYTRPSWWLPRPVLSNNAREVWLLHEVEADVTEYNGIDFSTAEILPNGKKQAWERITNIISNVNGYFVISSTYNGTRFPYAVEIILNSDAPINFNYRYQKQDFQKLQIITGTALDIGNYLNDGFKDSYSLKMIDCPVVLGKNNDIGLFMNTAIEKAPENITSNNARIPNIYRNCKQLVDGGYVNGINMTNAFDGCERLTKVTLGSACAGITTSTFTNCINLEDITVEKGFNCSLYIHHSTKYTTETLHAIIENYADMTGQTAPTFQVGETNLEKIDDEHKAMLEAKNINYL